MICLTLEYCLNWNLEGSKIDVAGQSVLGEPFNATVDEIHVGLDEGLGLSFATKPRDA